MRLFLAIDVPDTLRAAIVPLRVLPHDGATVRWVEPSALHLTIRFLGEVEDERLPRIVQAVGQELRTFAPLRLRLAGGGAFGARGRPRVLWIGVEGDLDGLSALAAAVERAVVLAGCPPEMRRFHPHVTLGRVRSGRPVTLLRALDDLGPLAELLADAVVLVRSETLPQGARHTALHRFPLEGANRAGAPPDP